ncbi:Myrcene synthase protein, partial [Thalictrum thalictroides]
SNWQVSDTKLSFRWELEVMEGLPEYMIICFLALFNTTNDIVYMKYKKNEFDILPHEKKVWADFCKAILVEAKWNKMGYTPLLNEYLENAWVSSSTTINLVIAFFGTGQPVTKDALTSLYDKPGLIHYSSMILRLCNDLATSSAELERGDVKSAIQSQMHEDHTSQQVSREIIADLISEIWKKLNESIYNTPFKDSFINIVVNQARTAHSIYQHGDGIGVQDHEAKKRVTELLYEPFTI